MPRLPILLRHRLYPNRETMYSDSMQVTFNIPDEVASQLLAAGADASQSALEAFAVESYRSGRLTESEVRRMLGYETRMEVHALLAEHDVCLHYSAEHLQQDIAASDRLRALRTSPPTNTR